MNIDIAGLSETNPPRKNHVLHENYKRTADKYGGIIKTHFSSADDSIDPIEPTTFQQSGGTATTAYGGWTTTLRKYIIKDLTGLAWQMERRHRRQQTR
jgi:hypothetical protein